MNSGYSLLHTWKNNSQASKDILEITNLSPLSTPKGSIFSRQHKGLLSPREDQEENSCFIASVIKENEELKKNLDLVIHNYENLCGKMKIQNEDFLKFKDRTQESQFFNEIQIKDQFFDLYYKVCPEEENRLRFKSQFQESPKVFFTEILNKFEKLKENTEIQAFLLEKSQEENKNLLSKFSIDQDYYSKKEAELRAHYIKELDMTKCEILRQKGKKRELKVKLNEITNNYQIKFLESQSLAEELSLAQSQESKVFEQVKDKKREILVIEQENKVKTDQIQELKLSLKQREIEIQEIKAKFGKINKSENEKEKEIYSQQSLIDSLQSQLKAMKKLVEDTESRENHLEYSLRIKEAELKGVESKLALQMSINDRLKDSYSATKAEILKKYNEKLEEKEKLFQELQELNENLIKKLDSTHKTVQNMHEQSQIKEFERSLSVNQELNDSKMMLQGLISKLSTRTGENIIEPVSGLKDSIRVIDSLMIIIMNQLDSSNNQVKLIKAEMNKLQDDLHKGQMTIQELTIKSSTIHSNEMNSEHIKYLLKEKCNNRKFQINSLEVQIKEKETVHQQAIQMLKDKFSIKKQKLIEKNRLKDAELNELKKKLLETSSKVNENASILIENEKSLKNLLDEANLNLEAALEQNSCYKKQHEEDEVLIYKQNKYILKLEQEKETLKLTENSLKAERVSLILENNEKLKALQDNLAELNQIRRQETEEESLGSDDEENGEVKITKLFKQLQEKENTIKKANKRIMELQWAQRDVIDQCKENEEKMMATVELNEKMTEENDKLTEQINSLNEKIKVLELEIEEFKVKVRDLKENESRLKGYEATLQDTIEELKITNENNEDEILGLQTEINEFQSVLKTYADENLNLNVSNRSLSDMAKKLKEECEDLYRDKQVITANLTKVKQELATKESCFEIEQEGFEKMKEIMEQEKMNLEKQIIALQGQCENDDEKIKTLLEEMTKIGENKILLRKNTSTSLEKVDIIEKMQQELENLSEEILEYQGLNSDLQKKINEISNDFSIKELSLNEKVLKSTQELLKVKSDLKLLKTEKKSLIKTAEDQLKILEKIKSDLYDKDTLIKKLTEEKQVMGNYAKTKLQGQDLEDLINLKENFNTLNESYTQIQQQLAFNKNQYEEIIESLRKELDLILNDQKNTSNSMWKHVDQLNKQLEEKTRLLIEKESQLNLKLIR